MSNYYVKYNFSRVYATGGHGGCWDIVDPDGITLEYSFASEDAARFYAAALSAAYRRGCDDESDDAGGGAPKLWQSWEKRLIREVLEQDLTPEQMIERVTELQAELPGRSRSAITSQLQRMRGKRDADKLAREREELRQQLRAQQAPQLATKLPDTGPIPWPTKEQMTAGR